MITARTAIDLVVEIRYKLCCLGLWVESTSELIGDNLSDVVNAMLPSSISRRSTFPVKSCEFGRLSPPDLFDSDTSPLNQMYPTSLPSHFHPSYFTDWHTSTSSDMLPCTPTPMLLKTPNPFNIL